MDFRTPLARVRGLGSARDGTERFIAQRMTAIALVPLLIWFVASVVSLVGADYATVKEWVSTPFVTVLLLLLLGAVFYHAQIGLHEVFEDYLHSDLVKTTAMVLMKFTITTLGLFSALAVLRTALGG